MLDLDLPAEADLSIVPGRKLPARVAAVFAAPHGRFQTEQCATLSLGFDGIAGDFHVGVTRRSGGREPWYQRGTEMRNERQVTIVAADELARVAAAMGIPQIGPEWIGANMVLNGVARLSMLPRGTLLFCESGATLKVDGQNVPCRLAGASIADHAGMTDREAGALLFVKSARRLRGLVAWVEKPGVITAGEGVSVRIPEQWIYTY